MESRINSLVTVLPGDPSGTQVVDEINSLFSVLEVQSNEPFTVSEYFCGFEYYTYGTEYRWLQRYNDSSTDGRETWSLGDVSITYFERGFHCSATLTEYNFHNEDGSKLDSLNWSPPVCEQGSLEQDMIYLFNVSEVGGFAQRSVHMIPEWWNSECSNRTSEGLLSVFLCLSLLMMQVVN